MPRTAAWHKFQISRKESLDIFNMAENADDSLPSGFRLSLRERLLRLFVVSIVGHLQAYVSELLEEFCDSLGDNWGALTPLQQRYVATHIYRRILELTQTYPESDFNDPKKVDQFTKNLTACVGWYQKPSTLSANVLRQDLEGFLGDNGSRALDKTLTLYRPDGMRFSDWLGAKPAYRTTLEILDNAIRLRNEAAHGKIQQRITVLDARRYRAVVTRLVQMADEYIAGN